MPQFLIGNILLQVDYAGVPVISEGNLQRFLHCGNWDGDTAKLDCSSEDLTLYQFHQLKRDNHVYGIYAHQDQTCIMYHWGKLVHGFAVWPQRFAVTFDPRMYDQTPLREDWFFSVCAFHRQLLLRDACVFHASYVDIGAEAILFTGPSNIGKSTQAGLWTQYAAAEVINGDRTLLRKNNGKWHAFGYPCCGTSGICINRTLPLKAIIVLSQANENRVERLSAGESIRALVSATELYPWDQEEIGMALNIAQNLAMEVPILKLSCRPDREAVEILRDYLEENT
ncbi:MAG: hypothetical protein J6V34_01160 [Oscillospiraceae bacterium]|nr:hypothetical protein [Oscillospiraceae bacterium]